MRDDRSKQLRPDHHRAPAEGRDEPVSFVIVLWLEPQSAAGAPEWRWRVRSAQTGDEAYFRRVAELLTYVATQTGLEEPR